MFGNLTEQKIQEIIKKLSPEDGQALIDCWQLWALKHQRMPPGEWRRWIQRAGRGGGKALSLDTKLPTPAGWTTMGDVQVGDRLFDERGEPCTVTYVTGIQRNRECYRVVFDDGSEIVADGEHRWFTWDKRARKAHGRSSNPTCHPDVRDTNEIRDTIKADDGRETNHSIVLAGALQLDECQLPIKPYTLGIWLGDGSKSTASITVADSEVDVLRSIEADGYIVRKQPSQVQENCCGFRILHPEDVPGSNTSPNITRILRQLDLIAEPKQKRKKSIPQVYLRASYGQRMDLLQGLMDSDGYAAEDGGCEFCSMDESLALGVFELAASLGIKPTLQTGRAMLDGKDYGTKYRVMFTTRHSVFRLKRKLSRLAADRGQKNRTTHRYIVAVEPVESVPVKCITVDSASHLYLVGPSMIPTHNTHGGSATINEIAEDRSKIRTGDIAIIGRTYADVRFTCIEGSSGILNTAKSDFRPVWEPGNALLTWPNGVRGRAFSADKPESIRGLNASAVWADEICHWPDPEKTWWEAIEPALRIGWARAIITTTPIPDPFLRKLEAMDDTVVTRASTFDNPHLHEKVLASLRKNFEGTRRGQQELYGEILENDARFLWNLDTIAASRVRNRPDLQRVVISIDPAASDNENSDSTGIIAVGIDKNEEAYVLEDATMRGKPLEWAARAIQLYRRYKADRIVAERNNGGDMVEAVIRSVDRNVPYTSVWASRGKRMRAEPVAALYEQGRVHHVGVFEELEREMCDWQAGQPSPDRMDALVWGLTDLLLDEEEAVGDLSAYL